MRGIISKFIELEFYEKVIMGLCVPFVLLMVTLVMLNVVKF